MSGRRRWLPLATGVGMAVLVVALGARFPWHETARALTAARWDLLAAAVAVNLSTLFFKAWAWHLVLRPSAPHSFRSAQVATLVGAAVGSLSLSLGGEAARIHVLAQREGLGYRPAAAAVIASRCIEAIGFAVLLGLALGLSSRGHWTALALGMGGIAALGFAAWEFRSALRITRWLPAQLQRWFGPLFSALRPSVLALALLLGISSWIGEWAVYHWSIVATGIQPDPTASLDALILSNLAGMPHLTPGNMGVVQAAVAAALVPRGVSLGRALGAGVMLQAVQILPVVALGTALATGTVRALLTQPSVVQRVESALSTPSGGASTSVDRD
jgi:uncharacterized protein (TIRG00374 family)